MTREQILQEFDLLPYDEQMGLAKAIEERLRRSEKEMKGMPKDAEEEFDASAVDRLHGAIKWNGPPPTDEEVEQMRYDYLMEKYG